MANWDTRTKQFNIIIDLPIGYDQVKFDDDIKRCCDTLSQNGFIYFCAKHDKDTNIEGVLKVLHYHLVIVASKVKRCSTICYFLAEILGYDINVIQVQAVDNLALAVQYLTHKNDSKKYQYDFSIITTNNEESLSGMYACESASLKIDVNFLFHLVDYGYTPLEIMFKIGLGNYTMYKKVISELYETRKHFPQLWGKLTLLYGESNNG